MTNILVPADLHIHIGSTISGKPVKITASRQMTFSSVLHESCVRKGLGMIGLIDAHVPEVQQEIAEGLQKGIFQEQSGGGIRYQETTCLLGVELELMVQRGLAHFLVYLPDLTQMRSFTQWLCLCMKNIHLSTQRLYQTPDQLLSKVEELGGLLIPAHVFTPFRSLFGSAADHLSDVLPVNRIMGIELGLSSDTAMADQISELQDHTFLTNSDAHSIGKIAREYQILELPEASFSEFTSVLRQENGRKVVANYGFHPKLGKYYGSVCLNCGMPWIKGAVQCKTCKSKRRVKGVSERINEIADQMSKSPVHRPPYIHQVPLAMLPGIGPKTLDRLLEKVGTEMYLLHQATEQELTDASNSKVAQTIIRARSGQLTIQEGGGGIYGKAH